MNILIVRLSSFGDVLFTTPLLNALRREHPNARIDFVVQRKFRQAIECHPAVGRVIEYPASKNRLPLRELGRFAAELRRTRYDVAIDLHNVASSAASLLVARTRRRVGNARQRLSRLYSLRCRFDDANRTARIHAAKTALMYGVEAALLSTAVLDEPLQLDFFTPPGTAAAVDRFLARHGLAGIELAGINPGGSYPFKRWRPEGFAAVADFVSANYDLPILLFGGPSEKRVAAEVAERTSVPVVDTTELSLYEAFELIGRLRLLVTNDSAPLHVAAARGVPTVGLYGPANFRKYSPLSACAIPLRAVRTPEIEALPNAVQRNDPRCFGELAVTEVLAACQQLLGVPRPGYAVQAISPSELLRNAATPSLSPGLRPGVLERVV